MSDDDPHTAITVPGFPRLTVVRLYNSTMNHIAEKEEFHLPADAPLIEHAVASPSAIYESRTNPENAVVLVSDGFTFQGNPLFVPVTVMSGTTSGRISTAYFSSRPYKGRLLWTKSSV